jgi:hypothetical protein
VVLSVDTFLSERLTKQHAAKVSTGCVAFWISLLTYLSVSVKMFAHFAGCNFP